MTKPAEHVPSGPSSAVAAEPRLRAAFFGSAHGAAQTMVQISRTKRNAKND